jgi:ribose/xylose/arabinose/galactoside ABC-type transport system permease subunit
MMATTIEALKVRDAMALTVLSEAEVLRADIRGCFFGLLLSRLDLSALCVTLGIMTCCRWSRLPAMAPYTEPRFGFRMRWCK